LDYTHLGRTGLKVSRLALGTMNFGELTDEKSSFSIMDEALGAGINFFDTAEKLDAASRAIDDLKSAGSYFAKKRIATSSGGERKT
jgi:aryl-alcohol dehydrogenase-like predicted oxidoreductase